jgi:hypothetical protein
MAQREALPPYPRENGAVLPRQEHLSGVKSALPNESFPLGTTSFIGIGLVEYSQGRMEPYARKANHKVVSGCLCKYPPHQVQNSSFFLSGEGVWGRGRRLSLLFFKFECLVWY